MLACWILSGRKKIEWRPLQLPRMILCCRKHEIQTGHNIWFLRQWRLRSLVSHLYNAGLVKDPYFHGTFQTRWELKQWLAICILHFIVWKILLKYILGHSFPFEFCLLVGFFIHIIEMRFHHMVLLLDSTSRFLCSQCFTDLCNVYFTWFNNLQLNSQTWFTDTILKFNEWTLKEWHHIFHPVQIYFDKFCNQIEPFLKKGHVRAWSRSLYIHIWSNFTWSFWILSCYTWSYHV